MAIDLSKIKNIVVVMLENRSFDHMLGYLSLPPFSRKDVDGQNADPAWLTRFTNSDGDLSHRPFLSADPHTMPEEFDPPHERPNVAANLGKLQGDRYPMNGFVSGIPSKVAVDPAVRKLVMSYFGVDQAPMNHFFAQNFTICDKWFSSLPAGTQPNRLMSMSGYSKIDLNCKILPEHELVYDWLTKNKISWRVYHQGIPFFAMMPRWLPKILLNDHFRDFKKLEEDLGNTPPDELPQVIFVEPTYQDAPHLGFGTDDHAPAGISNGQEFLMETYNAVISSRSFWKGAAMIVDYDEHGGFFDHVSPPMIGTNPPPGANYTAPFVSLGVRTPAHVISPFVQKGAVNHTLLDHTSVLKFIGEKFGDKGSYSPLVDARPVGSVSAVLDFDNPIADPPPPPPLDTYLAARPPKPEGATVPVPNTSLQQGFQAALESLIQSGAGLDHAKFGELLRAVRDMAV
jgi:phospholipase C